MSVCIRNGVKYEIRTNLACFNECIECIYIVPGLPDRRSRHALLEDIFAEVIGLSEEWLISV